MDSSTSIYIADRDKKIDNLSIGKNKTDIFEGANDPSKNINIIDVDKRANLRIGTNILDINRRKDNLSTRKADIDKKVDNPGINQKTNNEMYNPSIDIRTKNANKQANISNQAHMFLFSLFNALFSFFF